MSENNVLVNAVLAAQKGDQGAFTYLYNSTYKDKYYVALKYMKNEQDAMDILQDSYVKAFKNINMLNNPEDFPAWMSKIVSNTAVSALRKNKPVLFSDLSSENEEGDEFVYEIADESIASNPEASYTQNETKEMVNELLEGLSPEQKMAIIMFHFEGLSIRDIAESMGCNENTVKSRLNLGRKNLKASCEELQKKGYKLYSFSPIALLAFLLRLDLFTNFKVSVPAAGTVISAATGLANTAGVQAGAAPSGLANTVGAQAGAPSSGLANTSGVSASQAPSGLANTSGVSASQASSGVVNTSGVSASQAPSGVVNTSGVSASHAPSSVVNTSGVNASTVPNAANTVPNAAGASTVPSTATIVPKAAKKGLLSTIAGKVTLATSVVAVTTAATIGVAAMRNKPDDSMSNATPSVAVMAEESPTPTQALTSTPIPTPTVTPTPEPVKVLTEEEAMALYDSYVNDVLMTEYGEAAESDVDVIDPPRTKVEEFEPVYKNGENKGIVKVFYADINADEIPEMLVFRLEKNLQYEWGGTLDTKFDGWDYFIENSVDRSLLVEVYGIEDEEVVKLNVNSDSEEGIKYIASEKWQDESLGRYSGSYMSENSIVHYVTTKTGRQIMIVSRQKKESNAYMSSLDYDFTFSQVFYELVDGEVVAIGYYDSHNLCVGDEKKEIENYYEMLRDTFDFDIEIKDETALKEQEAKLHEEYENVDMYVYDIPDPSASPRLESEYNDFANTYADKMICEMSGSEDYANGKIKVTFNITK